VENRGTSQQLEKLREQLDNETEEQLLKRTFKFYNGEAERWETRQVQYLKDTAISQTKEYMKTLKAGRARDANGVSDNRIRCDVGHGSVSGFVVICVGASRVLTWAVGSEETQHSFSMTV
jgi:hypothetical protein